MKVFAINETEWIAAETQEEALEFEGIGPEEIEAGTSIDEIPEKDWDEPMECYRQDCENDEPPIIMSIREILAIQTEFPCKIMTEMD